MSNECKVETSNRCIVKILENSVQKIYRVDESFKQESENYRRLKDRYYVPNLINIDEEKKSIKIEKIEGLSLSEFVEQKGHLPYNLASKFKEILLDMASVGIVDTPDFYKDEHIFIVNGDIKIIDFDVNISVCKNNKNYNTCVEMRKKFIQEEYAFLNGDENNSSWNNFQHKLVSAGVSNEAIQDFYKHMDK